MPQIIRIPILSLVKEVMLELDGILNLDHTMPQLFLLTIYYELMSKKEFLVR